MRKAIQNDETKEPLDPLPGSGLRATDEYPYWSSGHPPPPPTLPRGSALTHS